MLRAGHVAGRRADRSVRIVRNSWTEADGWRGFAQLLPPIHIHKAKHRAARPPRRSSHTPCTEDARMPSDHEALAPIDAAGQAFGCPHPQEVSDGEALNRERASTARRGGSLKVRLPYREREMMTKNASVGTKMHRENIHGLRLQKTLRKRKIRSIPKSGQSASRGIISGRTPYRAYPSLSSIRANSGPPLSTIDPFTITCTRSGAMYSRIRA